VLYAGQSHAAELSKLLSADSPVAGQRDSAGA